MLRTDRKTKQISLDRRNHIAGLQKMKTLPRNGKNMLNSHLQLLVTYWSQSKTRALTFLHFMTYFIMQEKNLIPEVSFSPFIIYLFFIWQNQLKKYEQSTTFSKLKYSPYLIGIFFSLN